MFVAFAEWVHATLGEEGLFLVVSVELNVYLLIVYLFVSYLILKTDISVNGRQMWETNGSRKCTWAAWSVILFLVYVFVLKVFMELDLPHAFVFSSIATLAASWIAFIERARDMMKIFAPYSEQEIKKKKYLEDATRAYGEHIEYMKTTEFIRTLNAEGGTIRVIKGAYKPA